MTAALLTLHQVVLMLLLMGVGMACARLGWFDERLAQALSRFLLWFVTPALLLDAFYQPFRADMARGLLTAGILAVVFHGMAALLAHCLLRPGRYPQCAVARMGMVYSNCGFMAFPLIAAVIGEQGVFFGSAFVGVFNIFLWTHGQRLLAGREKFRLKNAVCNAGVLGTLAGIALYLTQLPLPSLAADLIGTLASLNTPLAMLVIGILLSHCRIKELFCRTAAVPSLYRMLLLPLLFLVVLLCLPLEGHDLLFAMLLCASCPAAASSVLMTSAFGLDSHYGAQLVLLSSLLSIITIPGVIFIASLVIQ